MKVWQVPPVNPPQRRPISHWEAYQLGKVVDTNNSIAILRSKWGATAIYKSVRK